MSPHRRTRLRDESGFTLPELLLGMVLMLVVGSAALLAAQTVERTSNLAYGRQTAAADVRVGLQRMTRDVRQATQIVVTSSRVMDLAVYDRAAPGTPAHVQWDCATTEGSCVRVRCSTPIGSGCTPTADRFTVTGVTNSDIFTPRNGQTQLALPASVSAANLGSTSIDFVELHLRLRVDRRSSGAQTAPSATHPNDFYDGADVAQYRN